MVKIPDNALNVGRIQYRENIIDLLKWLDRASSYIQEGKDFCPSKEERILEMNPPAWLVQKIKRQNRMKDEL